MLFEYYLMDDLDETSSPITLTFNIIGTLMLIGGIVELIREISSVRDSDFLTILLISITALGGLIFLYVANRSQKPQLNKLKYSIQLSDKKIIIKYEDGSNIKEMLTSEISKIDFNIKDIHISSKDSNKIVVDLGLISTEKKKNELSKVLKSLLENK